MSKSDIPNLDINLPERVKYKKSIGLMEGVESHKIR